MQLTGNVQGPILLAAIIALVRPLRFLGRRGHVFASEGLPKDLGIADRVCVDKDAAANMECLLVAERLGQ